MKKVFKDFNVQTGEETITEREETAAETKARTEAEAQAATLLAEAEAKATARAALLEKLGILAMKRLSYCHDQGQANRSGY
jgi:regulator of protease activity HflC (stomatin/prohibitin superfamily)